MKLVKATLGVFLVSMMLTGTALAAQIGVVDMQEISQKYSKAQDLSTQVKSKEEELQKLRSSLAEELKTKEKAKMSPVEKKNLEDKLNGQFASKFKEYREWTLTQEESIRADVDKAIQTVADNDKIDLVLPKENVLKGGKDITTEVLDQLNQSGASSQK